MKNVLTLTRLATLVLVFGSIVLVGIASAGNGGPDWDDKWYKGYYGGPGPGYLPAGHLPPPEYRQGIGIGAIPAGHLPPPEYRYGAGTGIYPVGAYPGYVPQSVPYSASYSQSYSVQTAPAQPFYASYY